MNQFSMILRYGKHVSAFIHTIFYSTLPKTYVATIMTIHSMSYFSASILETSIEGEVKWLPEMVRHILPTVLFSWRERKTQKWTLWNEVNAWKMKNQVLRLRLKNNTYYTLYCIQICDIKYFVHKTGYTGAFKHDLPQKLNSKYHQINAVTNICWWLIFSIKIHIKRLFWQTFCIVNEKRK